MKTVDTTTMDAHEIPRFREWLRDIMKTSVITVTFTKADGAIREMRCTLSAAHIPPQPVVEGAEPKTRRENSGTLAVWSVDDAGWRSFRLDRVNSVQFSLDDKSTG